MPVNHQLTCDQAFLWKKNKLNSTKRRNWRRNKTGVGRWSADLFVCCFFLLLVITGAHRLLVIVRNGPRSIKKNSNMNPRLPGCSSLLGLVFYVLKSLLGIARQRSREKFAIFVRMFRYRTQLLVPVPPECWIFKMASLCYFLVSSYRSALFVL